jgi:hypothetical protein
MLLWLNTCCHTAVNHEFDDIGVTSCSQRDRMRPEEDAPILATRQYNVLHGNSSALNWAAENDRIDTLQKALDAGAPLP